MSQTVLTKLQWIAERAAESEDWQYLSLANHITVDLLRMAHKAVRKDGAVGVDKQTARDYAEKLEENLETLHARLKSQKYRAPAVKRVWIPKDGGKRPLAIPTFEDKIVQRAVLLLLEPIYEEDFYDFSYGFRKGHSCHQALTAIRQQCMAGSTKWIIDADISDCFGSLDRATLREFLKRRIKDGGILRLIGKWLNAGILDGEQLRYSDSGAPQGGVVSPLLMNVYLHYTLDKWFEEEVKPRLRGKAFLVRFADDFVIGCEREADAQRIMEVLPKRLAKYHLRMNATKTRLIDFRKPTDTMKGRATFDFGGFTLYWGKSHRGNWAVKKRTAKKRLRRTIRSLYRWCKANRHEPIRYQHLKLRQKLHGHYAYFGVIGNYERMAEVWHWTKEAWRKWLNRRGGKNYITYEKFDAILATFPLPTPRIIHAI